MCITNRFGLQADLMAWNQDMKSIGQAGNVSANHQDLGGRGERERERKGGGGEGSSIKCHAQYDKC